MTEILYCLKVTQSKLKNNRLNDSIDYEGVLLEMILENADAGWLRVSADTPNKLGQSIRTGYKMSETVLISCDKPSNLPEYVIYRNKDHSTVRFESLNSFERAQLGKGLAEIEI